MAVIDRELIRKKFRLLKATMDERARRLWGGAEADVLGHGGVTAVAEATGMAISTVRKGRDEVRAGASRSDVVRVRRAGAGRRPVDEKDPDIRSMLTALVDEATRGDPESPLRWTLKSTRKLAAELTSKGHPISAQTVGKLLRMDGFSLQGTAKEREGKAHPDRDAQFKHISRRAKKFLSLGVPVISVDAKKKELVGDYSNGGREWHPRGKPVEVFTHDFPERVIRKAVPYGVYDVGDNSAYVNVGTNHDTPFFAVRSIEKWWTTMGRGRYPTAKRLFITADCGGSNSPRFRGWKAELQNFVDRYDLTVQVSHFPPGTSKWNKIEHRLFSFITINWRGRPLRTYETVVSLIASTTTSKGLLVDAGVDDTEYPLNTQVNEHVMRCLALEPDRFHGEWNYTLRPRSPGQRKRARAAPPVKRRKKKKSYWQQLVSEQLVSGLNGKEFCKARDIKYWTFSRWKHRLIGRTRRFKSDP